MQTWQMQDAKARLSELVKRATQDGPQNITVHGQSVAVVLSHEAFTALTAAHAAHAAQQSVLDFMQASPLYDLENITFPRDQSTTRETML
jgi:prevent-host-death family protein